MSIRRRTKQQIKQTWEYFGHDVRGAYKKVCAICKGTFFATVPGALYCRRRCAIDAQTIKDRNRRVNERRKSRSLQVRSASVPEQIANQSKPKK